MHPYEVATTLRSRAKDESIRLNYGSLYSVVEGLERRRMITPVETEREGRRPERTVYTVTDAGRAELVDWLSELLGTPSKEYPALEAGLSLMPALPPDDVVDLLTLRCTRLRLELEAMRATHELAAREGLPRLFSVEGEYRHALLEAELAFVASLRDDIAKGTLDGIEEWRNYSAAWYGPDAGRREARAAQTVTPKTAPKEAPASTEGAE